MTLYCLMRILITIKWVARSIDGISLLANLLRQFYLTKRVSDVNNIY